MFALYDIVFNVCYVLAVAVAALLSPARRASRPGCWRRTARLYLLGLLAHDRVLRRARPAVSERSVGQPDVRTPRSLGHAPV